ncbi:hypothetical protein ACIA49_05695 [Kribbella sp. NPDC051587]|uniref:hypothetical protein n=1 Tax=Kribbella sp. NPDC051587 TaxID=3364119 RepID=UPI0037924894
MNIPGKRLVLGAAVAVAALGTGGVAYAVGGDDPAPEQGYVTYDQSAADHGDCPNENVGKGQTQPEQNPAGDA